MSATNGAFRSYWGAIGVPILDKGDGTISNVTHDWANATAGLSGGLAITIMRLSIKNYRVDIAKERLAEMAVANGCQFILFIDDDVVPPADGLLKMIKRWREDPKYGLQTGIYFSKSEPAHPLLFKGNLEGSFWDWTTQDLIKVDGAGAGFLFVDTDIFKKLSKPWFSCDYFFDDPRSQYDVEKWGLGDRLVEELTAASPNPAIVKDLEKHLKNTGNKIEKAKNGWFDPNLLKNKHQDGNTTEDLYFFKKVKEELGVDLWADCSIQCWHQDKRTGRMFGLMPDMPQNKPRYEGRFEQGDKVVLDIGAGTSNYWIEEGKPITVDIDPKTNPDIVADARQLPIEDCFADMVVASHTLEHFSFRETISVLREWVRVLKIGGTLGLILPNLRWASRQVLDEPMDPDLAERAMFMYYSGQKGTLPEAHFDVHKAGFTPKSLAGVLSRIPELADIKITTSEGNFGNWKDHENNAGDGYNIIAFATKVKHNSAISLKLPIPMQEEAKSFIGEKANPIDLAKYGHGGGDIVAEAKLGNTEVQVKKVNGKNIIGHKPSKEVKVNNAVKARKTTPIEAPVVD